MKRSDIRAGHVYSDGLGNVRAVERIETPVGGNGLRVYYRVVAINERNRQIKPGDADDCALVTFAMWAWEEKEQS